MTQLDQTLLKYIIQYIQYNTLGFTVLCGNAALPILPKIVFFNHFCEIRSGCLQKNLKK